MQRLKEELQILQKVRLGRGIYSSITPKADQLLFKLALIFQQNQETKYSNSLLHSKINLMDKNNQRDQNSLGHQQSDFAGTNPDRYGQPTSENEQDNPVANNEAQNVNHNGDRLTGEEAEKARDKADEGLRQGRDQ
jgi:hypothetical protein